MAKLTLSPVANLQSEASAVQTINNNFDLIEAALEKTLSRDGTSPNTMTSLLDMNSQRLTNLPLPISGADAARLRDIQESRIIQGTTIPAFVENQLLMASSGALVFVAPASIPGIGNMQAANNLSELVSIPTARTNLGLGTAAVAAVGTSGDAVGKLNANLTFSGTLSLTGAVTATAAVDLGGTVNHRLTAVPTVLTADSLGFRGAPTNVQDATYTLVLNDTAKTIVHTSASAHTWTVPPVSSVAYPDGTPILLCNIGSGAVTIARGAFVSLRIAGQATDKNMTLAQHGFATLFRVSGDTWYISGSGVT